ncbi:hypothetical protein JHK82_027494 [Glycine max]|uniref:HTH three-helical bundle domain-containing protein n=1 Tax=Glycine soja TaxID=3848 RepID=A0A445IKD4_GLYSO|nr:hypothetical protein JHK82_027494 [Glycine max]RZB86513.1 hypothetical protein D0Y65_026530 [Glycine soja]
MSSFPSSVERTVASSLLLLNTTSLSSPSLSKFQSGYNSSVVVPERRSGSKRLREISVSYGSSKSSSSSLTNDDDDDDDGDSSEKEIKSRSVSFSAVTRYHQMKLEIARKIRSKVAWTTSCSGDRKPNAGELAKVLSPASLSGEVSSCLSSSSSGISSERSLRYAKRCRGAIVSVAGVNCETAAPSRCRAGSPNLRRRGEAILKLLSCCGGSSEVKIRQMLGDSPDTSKALRMYSLSLSLCHTRSHTHANCGMHDAP